MEELLEDFERREWAGGGDLVQFEVPEVELVDALLGLAKIGVDLKAVHVANDQQRWV